MYHKSLLSNLHELTKLHEGTKMHEETFTRAENFAGNIFARVDLFLFLYEF